MLQVEIQGAIDTVKFGQFGIILFLVGWLVRLGAEISLLPSCPTGEAEEVEIFVLSRILSRQRWRRG